MTATDPRTVWIGGHPQCDWGHGCPEPVTVVQIARDGVGDPVEIRPFCARHGAFANESKSRAVSIHPAGRA